MKKLLRHLTNAPVAVALAFLLVGAPSAPVGKMMPSSGEAMANPATNPDHYDDYIDPGCWVNGVADEDCDGLAGFNDPCPFDAANTCEEADDGASWWDGYLDWDATWLADWDCEFKLVGGIKLTVCNDMDGDGDLEGSICFTWEQGGYGRSEGVNCPDDPD